MACDAISRCSHVPGLLLLCAVVFLASTIGCTRTGSSAADRLIRDGDYQGAIEVLREAEAKDPSNVEIARDLGIVQYMAGNKYAAIETLEAAQAAKPKDRETVYYLARAYDEADMLDRALTAYADYIALGGEAQTEVSARIQALSVRKYEIQIQEALAEELWLKPAEIPENSIAVLEFMNVTKSQQYAPLSRGLAAMFMTDLSKVEQLRVLERLKMRVLLDELELAWGSREEASLAAQKLDWPPISEVSGIKMRLGSIRRRDSQEVYYDGPINDAKDGRYLDAVKSFQADHELTVDGVAGPQTRDVLSEALSAQRSSVVNQETAPEIGQLVGARQFVQGSFVPLGDEDIQLDASMVATDPSGLVRQTGPPVSGPVQSILRLEKELVYQTLETLGIEPTPEEREEIDKLPTKEFLAFLAYSQGLGFEDRGYLDDAAVAYNEAIRIDPDFNAAIARAALLRVSPNDLPNMDSRLVPHVPPVREPSPDRRERLDDTGSQSGLGPGPEEDRWDDEDPSPTDPEKISEDVSITIIIHFDTTGQPHARTKP